MVRVPAASTLSVFVVKTKSSDLKNNDYHHLFKTIQSNQRFVVYFSDDFDDVEGIDVLG